MRTGTILEVSISGDEAKKLPGSDDPTAVNINQPKDQILKTKMWLQGNDNEIPKSISIDMLSSRIFMLTARGFLVVYDLNTFDVCF